MERERIGRSPGILSYHDKYNTTYVVAISAPDSICYKHHLASRTFGG
jgi:hypothetical protein